VRIFNELEIDELIVLDILASKKGRCPDFQLLSELANECFMPLTYGGGVNRIEDINKILNIGIEKVAINTYAEENPDFITEAAEQFGNQCIIGAIDVKKNIFGKYTVYTCGGSKNTKMEPVNWAIKLAILGAGELLVTSIDKDGTWNGYDLELTRSISSAVPIPVIANGGAGTVDHLGKGVNIGGASALGVGSMVVYQNKGMGVLINFPDKTNLNRVLG